jgi:exodeoxyribonuclease VII large subunit
MFMSRSPRLDDDDVSAERLVAKDRTGDNAAPLTVSEISALLKRTVEDRFGFVRLRGELSGVKRAGSGHLYLCLKDENARLDGVMWRGSAQRLAFLAKTRARLEAEGLFDSRRKRPLPFLPGVIGVVTSPTGAVIRDILHRLADRFPSHVVVWPVLVQGQGASEQVAAAVRGFSELHAGGPVPRPDVVIVARGGGSIEDLWAFNEEAVVRAIAASTIPVISAVGHETDTTLADFAADLRAPTPTAAAELAVPVREELRAQLIELGLRKRRAVVRPVNLGRERLEARARHLPKPEALLAAASQRLDDQGERLRRGLGERIGIARHDLQGRTGRLSLPLLKARLARAGERLQAVRLAPAVLSARGALERGGLDSLARVAQSLNPDGILQRGYVRVTAADGRTLVSRAQAGSEAALSLHFRDGELAVVPVGGSPAKFRAAGRKPKTCQDDLFG